MKIPFSPPDITDEEIQEVVSALKSGWITTGPKVKEFEKKISSYCGTEKAVCLNSATAGLMLILKILGIKKGDEVITSAYTYTASASVINHIGAKIVFCDVKKGSYEIDYDQIASKITENTKAIIAVDIAGVICDYDRIYKIVESKKDIFVPSSEMQSNLGRIAVIADAAHSFGAIRNGIKSGAHADFSSFSFHAVKNLTTAEGGAVVWKNHPEIDNENLYKEFMLWSLHGQSKDALAKTKLGAWEYDIVYCGHKCNMTDIAAALGLVQFKRYEELLKRRFEIIKMYEEGLKGLPIEIIKHYGEDFKSSGHLLLTRVKGISEEQRNKIIEEMAIMGVATNVHYKPLPMHTAYKNLGLNIDDYPNAKEQFSNEITLPLHTLLTNEMVDYIIDCYKKVLQ